MQDKYGTTMQMQLYVQTFTVAPPTDTLQHTQLSSVHRCMIDLLRFTSYDRFIQTFNISNSVLLTYIFGVSRRVSSRTSVRQ